MALDLATSACVRRGPPFRRRSTARRPGHLSSTLSPMLCSEESSHPNAPDAVRLQGFTDRGGEFGFHVGPSSDVELREWRHAGAAEIQHGAASKIFVHSLFEIRNMCYSGFC